VTASSAAKASCEPRHSRVFTPIVIQMIARRRDRRARRLLFEVADMYEAEVDYDVKTLAANIEPCAYRLLAALVLVLALGVSCLSGTSGMRC